jgi:hypothetical protein
MSSTTGSPPAALTPQEKEEARALAADYEQATPPCRWRARRSELKAQLRVRLNCFAGHLPRRKLRESAKGPHTMLLFTSSPSDPLSRPHRHPRHQNGPAPMTVSPAMTHPSPTFAPGDLRVSAQNRAGDIAASITVAPSMTESVTLRSFRSHARADDRVSR